MQLIGINGEQHTGKTSLAESIQDVMPGTTHVEISDLVGEVANDFRDLYVQATKNEISDANHWLLELPDVLHSRLGLDVSYGDFTFSKNDVQLNPIKYMSLLAYTKKMKNTAFQEGHINKANKEVHREILQAIGGMVVSVQPHAWFEEAFKRINRTRTPLTTLGIISTVAFPSDAEYVRSHKGVIAKVVRAGHESALSARLDPTDKERSLVVADITVHNDGNLEQLRAAGKQIVRMVQTGQFPSTIVCSEL